MEKAYKKKRKLEKSKKDLTLTSPQHKELVKKSVKLNPAPVENQASKDAKIKKKKKKEMKELLGSQINFKQNVMKEDATLSSSTKKKTPEQKTEHQKLERNLIINILDDMEEYPNSNFSPTTSTDRKACDIPQNHKKRKLEKSLLLNVAEDEEDSLRSSNCDSLQTAFDDENACEGPTHIIAIDCEMVGVGDFGKKSILARVAIVNEFGKCIYDQFVKPTQPVTDYRTPISGIRARDINRGKDFVEVQNEVKALLKDRLLVGHALWNDLRVLCLNHPSKYTRDTARYKNFPGVSGKYSNKSPPLHILTKELLGIEIQKGEHNPIHDAQAALKVYLAYKDQWELGRQYKKKTQRRRLEKIKAARRKAMA